MSDGLLPDDNWAYSDGQRDGAENEREAIVAWLRREQLRLEALANRQSAYMRDEFTDGGAYWSDMAADAIENGEHLRGDDE